MYRILKLKFIIRKFGEILNRISMNLEGLNDFNMFVVRGFGKWFRNRSF